MSKTDSLHYKLCCEGAKWMKKHTYKYVAVELICTTAENPDVWGTNGFNSMLIEVKTSRADFLNDKKKFVRQKQNARFALGNFRYYLAPAGIIEKEELPENWGLLEWDGKSISVIRRAEMQAVENHPELSVLCSIMRREGIKNQIFNYRKNHETDTNEQRRV